MLDDRIARAEASGMVPLMRMGTTLVAYRFGILAWYDHPISSGPLEGVNNKIKTLKRQAYGIRYQKFFKLRTMASTRRSTLLTG